MTGADLPLDGERLFVAHWWNERTFARPSQDPMTVVAISSSPRSSGPLGAPALRRPQPRPSGRRQPSAAVRRRRAVAALVAFAALGALLGAGSLAGAGQVPAGRHVLDGPSAAVPVASTVHVVQPGDTLWTLARRLQPEGDVRPLVARLRAEHGSGALVPGQRLRLAV